MAFPTGSPPPPMTREVAHDPNAANNIVYAAPLMAPTQAAFTTAYATNQVQPHYEPLPPQMAAAYPQVHSMLNPHLVAASFQPVGIHQHYNEAADDDGELSPTEGKVHMLITGIDYACDSQSWAGPPPNGHGPLDTKYAFEMMKDLAWKSGADYMTLWNEQCTTEHMIEAINEVGAKCKPDDTFIFYYTGHGDQLPDPTGQERMDQCLCLVDANGNTDDATMTYRQQVWMRDDQLAKAITDATDARVKVLVLVDACHSGTICDFTEDSAWAQRRQRAISISGCEDNQTSAGTGKGGMFTRALTKAVQDTASSCPALKTSTIYNLTLEHYNQDRKPGHTQNIAIHGCAVRPHELVWPLHPKKAYSSPSTAKWRGRGGMFGLHLH